MNRSDMFETNNLGEVHIKNCMSVALAVMKSKIIASEKSSIGLIFFGTVRYSTVILSFDYVIVVVIFTHLTF